jgi:hypothetical protein
MKRLKRIVWTILALAFLAVSWLWDTLNPLIHKLVDWLPLDGLKQRIAAFMHRLPPYATLAVFLIPVVLIEPFKLVAVWLFAKKLWFAGMATYVAADLLRFGLVAFLFNTCKDKLLSIGWFRRLYEWFVWAHDWAYAQVAPLRAHLRQAFVEAGLVGGGRVSIWRRLAALWRYTRRGRMAA